MIGNYQTASTRLMIFGQETFGWDSWDVSLTPDAAIQRAIHLYTCFNLGMTYKALHFGTHAIS